MGEGYYITIVEWEWSFPISHRDRNGTEPDELKVHIILCVKKAVSLVINTYSAGIDFSRQNLPSKVNPRTVKVNIFIMAVDHVDP